LTLQTNSSTFPAVLVSLRWQLTKFFSKSSLIYSPELFRYVGLGVSPRL